MSPIWQATRSPVKSNYSIELTRGARIRAAKLSCSIESARGARTGSVKSNFLIELTRGARIRAIESNEATEPARGARIGLAKLSCSIESGAVSTSRAGAGQGVDKQ